MPQKSNQMERRVTPSTSLVEMNYGRTLEIDWVVPDATLKLLMRWGIDEEFIEDCRQVFVMAEREKKSVSHAWGSKFIAFVKPRWDTQKSRKKSKIEAWNNIMKQN